MINLRALFESVLPVYAFISGVVLFVWILPANNPLDYRTDPFWLQVGLTNFAISVALAVYMCFQHIDQEAGE